MDATNDDSLISLADAITRFNGLRAADYDTIHEISQQTSLLAQQVQSLQLQLQQQPLSQVLYAQKYPPPIINVQVPAPTMAYHMPPMGLPQPYLSLSSQPKLSPIIWMTLLPLTRAI